MQRFFSDLASGVRMLIKYPTLSSVAILTLGVGIGLSTTVFCVVNGGLFKGLPFPNGDRIVSLVATNPAQGQPQLSIPVHDLEVFLGRQTAFELAGPFAQAPFNISMEEGRPERIAGARMSVDGFRALGMEPALGRGFQPGDDAAGAPPIVLLGHDLWRDRFGADPGIVGQSIRADGVQRTVIGVMPPRFAFPFQQALWVPLHVDPRASQRGEKACVRVTAVRADELGIAGHDVA
jgi:hypothetical protein